MGFPAGFSKKIGKIKPFAPFSMNIELSLLEDTLASQQSHSDYQCP